ncbi:signal transduction histidine kinase [Oxalobacteraceae bacterium GrIS 2.11]
MKIAPLPSNELQRILALHELNVLDTQNEEQFDAVAQIAARVCDVPISLVSLVDIDRQWFKANVGLEDVSETPRSVAFCSHAILDGDILEISDTSVDQRFRDNPLVTGDPHIRFYAGAPISLADGSRIGTLCVIDRQVRRLDDHQKQILKHLSKVCSSLLEGRRSAEKIKQSAIDLFNSETLNRALITAIPDDIFTVRGDGQCIFTHISDRSLLFAPEKTYVNSHVNQLFAPAIAAAVLDAVKLALQSDAVQELSLWMQGTDIDQRYVEIRVVRSMDDAAVCIFRENTDRELDRRFRENFVGQISERLVLSEKELRDREQLIAIVVETVNLGYWTRDSAKDEIIASEHWRILFGFDMTETVRFADVMERVHPDDRAEFLKTVQSAVQSGEIYNNAYRIVLPNGQMRWIRTRARIKHFDDGRSAFLGGISFDVTSLKNDELELEQKRQEVTFLSRLATLGELSGAIAHELNQPLMSMLLNAESAQLVLKKHGVNIPELNEILHDIIEEDTRAAMVIQRLRQMFGNRGMERQQVDINGLLADVQSILRTGLMSRETRLELSLAEGEHLVLVDRVQLQQVLINLINNAADAMKDMGKGKRKIIVLTQITDGTTLQVSVSDQGSGIAAEALPKIFDPFFTSKDRGMGLGLSICKNIVDANSGRIWAENKPDGGAIVHVSFPLAAVEG